MLNPGHGRGPGSGCGASSGRKSGDAVPDQFPAGLRVLVVDDDPTCLKILEKMLRTCLYEVTRCNRAEIALSLLRQNRNGYDIVISDVHMPDMDGFKLLEHVGLEMDLPVIMMSADDSKQVVMKGVTHGACDYLIKPVRIEALKNIWQHVVRKRRSEWSIPEQSGSVEEGGATRPNEEADNNSSSVNEGNSGWRSAKRKKEEDEEGDEQEDKDESSNLKKPRVVWSVELHQQFVAAVNQLGVDKAVPKKILEMMNVPGLTRENVASHLQKYRIYLRRLGGVSQHSGNLGNSFMNPQDPNFGSLSSFNGFDLQALAVAGQIPTQSLAQLQAFGLAQPAAPRPAITVQPLVDQRNILGFDNHPKVRYGDGKPQNMNGNKQMNMLHGVSTGMELKHLGSLQNTVGNGRNVQVVGSHRIQNGQSSPMLMQPRGQVLPPSSSSQSVIPNNVTGRNSMPGNVLGRNVVQDNALRRNGVNEHGVQSYNGLSRPPASMFNNFRLNQAAEIPGNSFPIASAPGISIPASKVIPYQEEVSSSDTKGSNFAPSFDIFNDLQQHSKPQDWDLHNLGLGFVDPTQHSQGNLDAMSAFSVSEGYTASSSSVQRNGQNASVGHQINPVYVGNSVRVKSERVSEMGYGQPVYQDQYNQEDLMSALLKQQQQQEGIATAENEFDFDGYSIDNIPA